METSLSVNEDPDSELRDLVLQNLQKNGILSGIKAQLRANVYLALQENDQSHIIEKSGKSNKNLREFCQTSEGRLAVNLIREFLTFFDCKYTLSVFEPEVQGCQGDYSVKNREKLITSIGLGETTHLPKAPLLSEIIRLSKISVLKSETPTPTFEDDEDETEVSRQSSLKDDLQRESLLQTAVMRRNKSGSLNQEDETWDLFANAFQKEDPFANSRKSPEKMFDKKEETSSGLKLTSSSLSSLGDLPPLGGSKSSNLATKLKSSDKHKKDKKELLLKKKEEEEKKSLSISEEIDEEIIDEFLASSVSGGLSDDFTKDVSLASSKSLKADYVESL